MRRWPTACLWVTIQATTLSWRLVVHPFNLIISTKSRTCTMLKTYKNLVCTIVKKVPRHMPIHFDSVL